MFKKTSFLLVSAENEKKFFTLGPGPPGFKTFLMLNSTEHGISTAHKN